MAKWSHRSAEKSYALLIKTDTYLEPRVWRRFCDELHKAEAYGSHKHLFVRKQKKRFSFDKVLYL